MRRRCGLFLRSIAGTRGMAGENAQAQARANAEQEQEQEAVIPAEAIQLSCNHAKTLGPGFRRDDGGEASRFCVLLVLHRVPSAPAGVGRNGPKGARDGSRALRRQRRDALSAQPATAREPVGQDGRRASLQGYPFLGLPFFGQAKKGNRPAGMRDEPTGTWVGRRERSRAALQEQQPGARQSVLKQPSPAKRERAKRVLNE